MICVFFFFFQAEDGIRDLTVTGVQTCALPISTTLTARCIAVLVGLLLVLVFFGRATAGLVATLATLLATLLAGLAALIALIALTLALTLARVLTALLSALAALVSLARFAGSVLATTLLAATLARVARRSVFLRTTIARRRLAFTGLTRTSVVLFVERHSSTSLRCL